MNFIYSGVIEYLYNTESEKIRRKNERERERGRKTILSLQ
jgi:hypothetical protein